MAFFPGSAALQTATPTAGSRLTSRILYGITRCRYFPQVLENAWGMLGEAHSYYAAAMESTIPSRWRVTACPANRPDLATCGGAIYGEGLAPQPAFPVMWIDGWRPRAAQGQPKGSLHPPFASLCSPISKCSDGWLCTSFVS
ncbi:hypothetical protein F5B18DRAFT_651331 [Nemania serpens]|nr:hypothetical protein F5B18DRAFT_651331 [Nemania serpens]